MKPIRFIYLFIVFLSGMQPFCSGLQYPEICAKFDRTHASIQAARHDFLTEWISLRRRYMRVLGNLPLSNPDGRCCLNAVLIFFFTCIQRAFVRLPIRVNSQTVKKGGVSAYDMAGCVERIRNALLILGAHYYSTIDPRDLIMRPSLLFRLFATLFNEHLWDMTEHVTIIPLDDGFEESFRDKIEKSIQACKATLVGLDIVALNRRKTFIISRDCYSLHPREHYADASVPDEIMIEDAPYVLRAVLVFHRDYQLRHYDGIRVLSPESAYGHTTTYVCHDDRTWSFYDNGQSIAIGSLQASTLHPYAEVFDDLLVYGAAQRPLSIDAVDGACHAYPWSPYRCRRSYPALLLYELGTPFHDVIPPPPKVRR